jgi:hypothetical protein
MRGARLTRGRLAKLRSASSLSFGRLLACLVVGATLQQWTTAWAETVKPAVDQTSSAAAPAVESMPVPADLQVPALLKVLAFDRNFDKRGWTTLRIGIVFVGSDPASSKARSDILDVFKRSSDKTLRNLPISVAAVEYRSDSQIEDVVKTSQFNVLYIAPGNARNLPKLLQVSQSQQIITTTGVPDYVQKGVAVGIGVRQDRPEILINLQSSKSAGSEFDASLLRLRGLVRVIR